MARFILALLVFVIPISATADCMGRHTRHWYYQGYNRQDIYRYGAPEGGGYRGGHYSGWYHDNTHYDD
jgi:uncharacterized membrane protein